MGWAIAIYAMRALEVGFFGGMTGCFFCVLISWIQVGGDSFSADDEE